MGRTVLKYLAILFVMLGGLSADYKAKEWARDNLKDNSTIIVVKNFIDLGYSENSGMIFGIMNGQMSKYSKTIVIVFRILILIGLMAFIVVNRKKSFIFLLPFSLFWAGAIGNLIDPFVYGHVIDFIHIQAGTIINWPFYFNLADAYITIGMALLLISEALKDLRKKKRPVAA